MISIHNEAIIKDISVSYIYKKKKKTWSNGTKQLPHTIPFIPDENKYINCETIIQTTNPLWCG